MTLLLLTLLGCPPKPVVTDPGLDPVTQPDPGTGATPSTDLGTSSALTPTMPTVGAPPGPEDVFQREMEDVATLLAAPNQNNVQTALGRLESMANTHPNSAVVFYNLGLSYYHLGRRSDARQAWRKSAQLDPKMVKAWLNLGSMSLQDKDAAGALEIYQTGLRSSPNDVSLRVGAIAALRELKRYDEAIAQAKAALYINSNSVDVYNNLAHVYLDTNQVDLATFVLTKALASVPGADASANLHALMGEVFYRRGLRADAVLSYEKSLQLDPNQLSALLFQASYFLDNRAYADALPLLERAVALSPNHTGARINLGIAFRGLGRYEDAKRVYEEALAVDPLNPEPHRNLAVLYGDYMKAYDAAVDAIEKYRRAGGGPAAELDEWVASIRKEQKKIADKKKRDEDRSRKEAERAARDAEAKAAEEKAAAEAAAAAGTPPVPGPDGGVLPADPGGSASPPGGVSLPPGGDVVITPVPTPDLAPSPAPGFVEPSPAPSPTPELVPAPAPEVEPTPAPAPAPPVVPTPSPAPEPAPAPAPEPAPVEPTPSQPVPPVDPNGGVPNPWG